MKTPLLSIQTRVLVDLVGLTLTSIAVVTWQGYRSARASLTEAAERQLVGLQRAKSEQVATILATTRRQVIALSGTELFTGAARDLLSAYREVSRSPVTGAMKQAVEQFYQRDLEPALARRSAIVPPPGAFVPQNSGALYLQYHYVVPAGATYDGSGVLASGSDTGPYAAALSRHSGPLRGALDRLGTMSHAAAQTSARGLLQLPAEHRAQDQPATVPTRKQSQGDGAGPPGGKDVDDYRVSDFESWRPSLGSPMGFVGSPVFDGPRMIAVMVQRFRLRPIAQALSDDGKWTGLGKTGELYLLGGDLTMRTDSRFLLEDRAAFLEALRHSTLTARTAETVERLTARLFRSGTKRRRLRCATMGVIGDDYRGVRYSWPLAPSTWTPCGGR
jgi:hypothetical protein